MERPLRAFLFLLILFLSRMIVSSQVVLKKEFDGSLESVVKKHHMHKHSGFTAAECPGACTYRCSKTAYKKPCMFFCQSVASNVNVFHPGLTPTKFARYNNWKTKRGGPKCP